MIFLTYVKYILSLSIEHCFKELAITASFEIEKIDFEKNGCILFGFYIITCIDSQKKLKDELKQQDVNFSEDEWEVVLLQIAKFGFFSALRLFYASSLLPKEQKYSHEKFETKISAIYKEINQIYPYVIKYLNKRTDEFVKGTSLYDANINEFFKNYFSFFNKLLQHNSFASHILYMNYIIISKNLSTDDSERNVVKDVIRNEYKENHSKFSDTLEKIHNIYDDEKYIDVISLENIKKKYQEIHHFIDNLENVEGEI